MVKRRSLTILKCVKCNLTGKLDSLQLHNLSGMLLKAAITLVNFETLTKVIATCLTCAEVYRNTTL